MIQEFGENFYGLEDIDDYEPDPHLIQPYPILRLMDQADSESDEGDGTDGEDSNDSADECSTGDETDSGDLAEQDSADADSAHQISTGDDTASSDVPTADMASVSISSADDKSSSSPTSNHIPPSQPPFKELPKLEEFIPEEYFPDFLLVHDPDQLTPGVSERSSGDPSQKSDDPVVQYKRLWPAFDSDVPPKAPSGKKAGPETNDGLESRTAHLYLSAQCRMGVGHHSLVYRAALTLPPPLAANSPTGQVTVAAKVAMPGSSARAMLHTEADIYNKFPKHLMEDWSGFNLVAPHKWPVPADAIVPKFYGYYVPVKSRQTLSQRSLSPILLVEECGVPIDPRKLSIDERSQCYTHMLRLHYADFIQNSGYVRNIMVQPGPLHRPPSERSIKTPSFRIIDFGRGEVFPDWFKKMYYEHPSEVRKDDSRLQEKYRAWASKVTDQELSLRHELGISEGDA